MNKIITILTSITISITLFAIPAQKGMWRKFIINNNKEVMLQLIGDEHFHYWQDTEDKRYVINEDNIAVEISEESLNTRAFQKHILNNRRRFSRIAQNTVHTSSYTGVKKGLILMVDFSDTKFLPQHTNSLISRMANENGFTTNEGFIGSVKDYFKAQSNGRLEIDFDVIGPIHLSNKVSFYGKNDSDGSDQKAGKMVADACMAVADKVDFSKYDWNNDGEVDQIYIMYAGQGEATGGSSSTIWPHEWTLSASDYGGTLSIKGIIINTYACGNELSEDNKLMGIGVICHEFSHCLGFPDMYDTSYKNIYGMAHWDIMAAGCYNGDTYIPAGYTSYEKMSLGWLSPVELKEEKDIDGIKPLSNEGEAYIMYNENNKDEYYLIEHRGKHDWDKALPNDGLLITHVDYNKDSWESNTVNTEKEHQRCYVIAADDSYLSVDENHDVYPYKENNSFTPDTKPNIFWYNGSEDKLPNITDIKKNDDGTMSFHVSYSNGIKKQEQEMPDTIFYESFDSCKGKGGNDNIWSGSKVAIASFIPDNIGWKQLDSKTCLEFGANKCAKFGSSKYYNAETSPEITISKGAHLSFKAGGWGNRIQHIRIVSNNNRIILKNDYFELEPQQWTQCETEIFGSGTFRLSFSPRLENILFLDEVIITPLNTISYIREIEDIKSRTTNIYSISGKFLGNDIRKLSKGVYIINGKKVVL